MKLNQRITILLLIILFHHSLSSNEIINGTIDLSNNQNPIVNLNGIWVFYWGEFLSLDEIQKKQITFCDVPGNWISCNSEKKGQGYATYYLKIRINEKWLNEELALYIPTIGTSYRIYINDKLYEEVGIVSTEKEKQIPMYGNRIISWKADSIEQDIIIHVSNFYHKSGGLWYKILFGKKNDIENEFIRYLSFDFGLFGAIFIMALYHLGLYFQKTFQHRNSIKEDILENHNQISILFFSLFCFFLSIRILFVDHYFIYRLLSPSIINWFLFVRIEYSTHILGFLWISLFYIYTFDFLLNKYIKWIVITGTSYFFLELIIFNTIVFTSHLIYFQIFLITISIYLIIILFRNVLLKKAGALEAFIGGFILLLFTINDILHARSIIQTAYLATSGLFLFILINAFSISKIFELTFLNIKNIINKLKEENQLLNTFVPVKFLKLFNIDKKEVLKLNRKIKQKLIILSIKIISKENISNFIIPDELISKFIKISKSYDGELEKFDNENFIFLFPENNFDIINYLNELFTINKNSDLQYLSFSIVIHQEDVEFEPIRVGNEITFNIFLQNKNTLKKMMQIAQTFNITILLSEAILNHFHLLENINDVRFIKNLEINESKIPLWELYQFDEHTLKEHKNQTKNEYIQALKLIQTKYFLNATEILNRIYKNNTKDLLYLYYMNQIFFDPSNSKFLEDIVISNEKSFNFNYEVGNKLLNYQHELLIKCIIKLNLLIKNENVIDKYQFIEDILIFLKLYSLVHFSSEEYIMEILNYKDLNEHTIEHEVFISTIESFFTQILWDKTHKERGIDDFKNIKASMLQSISNYLHNWIINHILFSDIQGYSKYLTPKEKILFENWFDI